MVFTSIEIRRFQQGRPVIEPIGVCFDRDTNRLMLLTEHRKRKNSYKLATLYELREIVTDIPGRAFHLVRLTKPSDPFDHDKYAVLLELNGKARCDCPGWTAKQWISQHCKHVEALQWLNDNGHLDPEACQSCGATDCKIVGGFCDECGPDPILFEETTPDGRLIVENYVDAGQY